MVDLTTGRECSMLVSLCQNIYLVLNKQLYVAGVKVFGAHAKII